MTINALYALYALNALYGARSGPARLRPTCVATMTTMSPPSGEQHVLVHGRQEAVVTEVGATLRSYAVAGVPICWGFGEQEMCGGSRGQVLAPWPNRLRDGRYEFDGALGRAPIDEPERMNAIHGLVRWLPWRLLGRSDSAARLACELHPQPAYPYRLGLEVEYELGDGGLAVSLLARSGADRPLPFGAGFHPYLAAGRGAVDDARLAIPARRRLLLDERALPVGSEEVRGTPFEAVTGSTPPEGRRPIGSLRLDDCFTGLETGPDRRWRVELFPGGQELPVVLWGEAVYRYVMCFTGDSLPVADRRLGIAVEPMTCPPDALRTGEDLVVIEPGGSLEASWGIVPPGAAGE